MIPRPAVKACRRSARRESTWRLTALSPHGCRATIRFLMQFPATEWSARIDRKRKQLTFQKALHRFDQRVCVLRRDDHDVVLVTRTAFLSDDDVALRVFIDCNRVDAL